MCPSAEGSSFWRSTWAFASLNAALGASFLEDKFTSQLVLVLVLGPHSSFVATFSFDDLGHLLRYVKGGLL